MERSAVYASIKRMSINLENNTLSFWRKKYHSLLISYIYR